MGSTASQQLHPNINENFLKMQASPAENILLTTSIIHNQPQLSRWASTLIKASQLKNHPILLPQQFKTTQRAPCGAQSTIEIKYQCYYMSFSDQIEGRKEKQKHFEQEQLWYILLTLVEAAEATHQLSTNLGDVKPSNLLLNKKGNMKVLTKLSKPNFAQSFHLQAPKDSLYSPEQLSIRKKGYKSNSANYLLSESFAIGIIMLAAGTITTASSLYSYSSNQINMIEFNKTLKYWEQFEFYSEIKKAKIAYSKKLRQIVCQLLKFEPEKRICSLQVNEILQNYKQQIMSLQKIMIQEQVIKGEGKLKTHRLQSRRKSELKESMQSSFSPSFNNSHDVSFQLKIPSVSSQLYRSSEKKNISVFSASSNKIKLSVTAHFQQRQDQR